MHSSRYADSEKLWVVVMDPDGSWDTVVWKAGSKQGNIAKIGDSEWRPMKEWSWCSSTTSNGADQNIDPESPVSSWSDEPTRRIYRVLQRSLFSFNDFLKNEWWMAIFHWKWTSIISSQQRCIHGFFSLYMDHMDTTASYPWENMIWVPRLWRNRWNCQNEWFAQSRLRCRKGPIADRYRIMEAAAACIWSIGSIWRLVTKYTMVLCVYLLRESPRPSALGNTLTYYVKRFVLSDLISSIMVLQAGYIMARWHEGMLINTIGCKVSCLSWLH